MRLAFARHLCPIINRRPAGDKSALRTSKAQCSPPCVIHPPERRHLRRAQARQLRKWSVAEPIRIAMRAGWVERRDKDKISPCAPRGTGLAAAMHRHGQTKAEATGLHCLALVALTQMHAISAPPHRQCRRSGKQYRQLAHLGDPHQPSHKAPSRTKRQMVVADHNPAAGRELCNDGDQGTVQPFISEQPACRQDRGVASRHGPFYRPVADRCNARE